MVAGEAWGQVAQMRRGVLPYCVLALLRDRELYGFELVRTLGEAGGMVTGEGTIYPLLGRLRRQGLVDTTWRESASGPPRRYYRLTAGGQEALAEFAGAWARLRDSVDGLLAPPAGPPGSPAPAGHPDHAGRLDHADSPATTTSRPETTGHPEATDHSRATGHPEATGHPRGAARRTLPTQQLTPRQPAARDNERSPRHDRG